MRNPGPLPFEDAQFSVRDARAAGATPARLRAGDLTAPHRGVRSTEPILTLDQRLAALECALPSYAFFSHQTAALIYGIPLPRRLEDGSLHVSVRVPAYPPRIRGAVGHRLSAEARSKTYRGHPVIVPVAAWAQLASVLGPDDLVVAGDTLVRRKYPLATLAAITDALDPGTGIRNVRALRQALSAIRPGTDSPMETRLRLLIVANGLPEPVVGHRIIDSDGYFVAAPDLAYPHAKVAIEYEGSIHQSDPAVFADDIARRERMEDAGWVVIRVIAAHFRRPDDLISRITRALSRR